MAVIAYFPRMFLRLKRGVLFLLVASAAWLPRAGAMIQPLHPSGGDFPAAVSSPVFPATQQETYILVYVYESENPYNGADVYVLSPLGLDAYMFGGTWVNDVDPFSKFYIESNIAELMALYAGQVNYQTGCRNRR